MIAEQYSTTNFQEKIPCSKLPNNMLSTSEEGVVPVSTSMCYDTLSDLTIMGINQVLKEVNKNKSYEKVGEISLYSAIEII